VTERTDPAIAQAGPGPGEAAPAGTLPAVARTRPIARIWATVDLERVAAELGLMPEPLPDDPLLGAAVRLVRPPGEIPIALLEPITEGRLAATLAKHGEGPAGQYVEALDGLASVRSDADRNRTAVSRPANGPFGPALLLLGGPVAGPHLVLVEPRAGTIDR